MVATTAERPIASLAGPSVRRVPLNVPTDVPAFVQQADLHAARGAGREGA